MTNLVWFDRFDSVEKACLGGKSASLGEMARAGLPVPPGFAITTHAFRAARDASGVIGAIALSAPVDTCSLAVTLTHEVQHVKLSALLDELQAGHGTDDLNKAPPSGAADHS